MSTTQTFHTCHGCGETNARYNMGWFIPENNDYLPERVWACADCGGANEDAYKAWAKARRAARKANRRPVMVDAGGFHAVGLMMGQKVRKGAAR